MSPEARSPADGLACPKKETCCFVGRSLVQPDVIFLNNVIMGAAVLVRTPCINTLPKQGPAFLWEKGGPTANPIESKRHFLP